MVITKPLLKSLNISKRCCLSVLLMFAVGLLSGCQQQPVAPPKPSVIPAFKGQETPSTGIPPIRLKAIQETAFSVGARGGLAWRSQQINAMLLRESSNLGEIFNFRALLLKDNVQPPILVEAKNTMNLADNDTIRLADKTYKIIEQAKFVTAPLTWRSYLWLDYKKPSPPNSTLLPRTKEERFVWDIYVTKGWEQGVEQANLIFEANLGKLKRDFAGMVLYRSLLAQNMISSPYVAQADLGITGGGDELRINDQVLRITDHSALIANSKKWKPAIQEGHLSRSKMEQEQKKMLEPPFPYK